MRPNIHNETKYLIERCPELIYNDKRSSYEELLQKDGSVFVHHKNIQELATEMFQVENALAPEIVKDSFVNSNEKHYNLPNESDF